MDVATWNVNSIRAHLDHLLKWLAVAKPDVLCIQETKVVDGLFPHAELEAAGYVHRAIHGQKTYNGVALISKRPISDVALGFTIGAPDEQARLVRATVDGVVIFGAYCPNGNPIGTEKYTYKLAWYERLHAELLTLDPATPVLVCGDFNVAPEDADVYDPFEAEGQVLCTAPERAAWRKLVDWGLVDLYRRRHPFGSDYSWWDYRMNGFRNNHGFRIDHVLVTAPLAARCTKVWIDRAPRAVEKASDHAPVIASFTG
jgi:exodeoxyribonuclease-3